MTREEAIKMLKYNSNVIHQTINGETDSKEVEALDMAIKALEQEPCEDWCNVLSDKMTLEQARQAVKDLRKKLAECLWQEPCEDCISRQAVLDLVNADWKYENLESDIANLPSVTPQQKTGRWIESKGYDDRDHFYSCSECGRCINLICGAKLADYPYCHCGAKMQEVEK